MSLRLRIFGACALLALLPAIPLTMAVHDLLSRSLRLALSPELQAGLAGGAQAARIALRAEREDFREACAALSHRADAVALALLADEPVDPPLPGAALLVAGDGAELARRGDWDPREAAVALRLAGEAAGPLSFPRGPDRDHLRAHLAPPGLPECHLIISRPVDPAFLDAFARVVAAQQLLAGLSLERPRLRTGFVQPFLIVYGVVLALSLAVAALLSRRLTRRLAQLAEGARRVGEGDWSVSLAREGDDEISRLVDSFNDMVGRLERQRRRLTDLEKMAAWREMARGLAHEIKNPLTPISLVIQEIRDRYDGHDATYHAFLDESGRIIEEEIESLRRLAREFGEFARMPEMNRAPGDLHALLRDLGHLYGSVAVELDFEARPFAYAFDAEHMRRAFGNLFENAVKALAGRGDAARIRVATRLAGGALRVEFGDNGPGVPEEIRGRIFEPHFTTKGSGMGLGLALVRSVVSLHGGAIRLDDGPGARFLIDLPLAPGPEPEERA